MDSRVFWLWLGIALGACLPSPKAQEPNTVELKKGEVAEMDGRLYSTEYDEHVRRSLKEAAAALEGCKKQEGKIPILLEARDKCLALRKRDAERLADISERLRLAQEAQKLEAPEMSFLRHLLYSGAIVAATVVTWTACDVGTTASGTDDLTRMKICLPSSALVGMALSVGLVW